MTHRRRKQSGAGMREFLVSLQSCKDSDQIHALTILNRIAAPKA